MCKTLGPQLGCAAKPTEYDHRKSLIEGDIWTEIMNIDREDSQVSDILSPLVFTWYKKHRTQLQAAWAQKVSDNTVP